LISCQGRAALLLLVPAITWAKKANVFSQIELLVVDEVRLELDRAIGQRLLE
jgi:hypothetical protein